MSILRITTIVLFVVLSGGGILKILRSLMQHATDPQNHNTSIGGIGATAMGIILFLVLWYGFAFMEVPGNFLRALKTGNDHAAFSLLTTDLQHDFENEQAFRLWADAIRPRRWFFHSSCSTFGEGRSDGSVRLQNGERSRISFNLYRDNKQWLIQGIQYWNLEQNYWIGSFSGLDCSD